MTAALPLETDYPFWCEEKLRNADTDQQEIGQQSGGAQRVGRDGHEGKELLKLLDHEGPPGDQ